MSGRSRRVRILSEKPSGVRGDAKAAPPVTNSFAKLTVSLTTTGTPDAIASNIVKPKFSACDGRTYTSASANASSRILGSAGPVSTVFASIPFALIQFTTRLLKAGGSGGPTIASRTSGLLGDHAPHRLNKQINAFFRVHSCEKEHQRAIVSAEVSQAEFSPFGKTFKLFSIETFGGNYRGRPSAQELQLHAFLPQRCIKLMKGSA